MVEERANIKHGTIRTDFHGLIELLAKNLYPQGYCLAWGSSWSREE